MKKAPIGPLVLGVLLLLAPGSVSGQNGTQGEACQAVFGVGDLQVQKWIDDPPEPFVVGGQFQVAINSTADLVRYLETEPERLTWYDATFSLTAFPGSDAPLPGDLSWAPCDSVWVLRRPGQLVLLDSFCESTMVPDLDEPGDIFEVFVREEIASIHFRGTKLSCGRLHLNGQWDAGSASAEEVTVSGKLCQCGPRLGSKQFTER